MRGFTISRLLVLVALVVFLLDAFHVAFGSIELIGLGLAVYMASHLLDSKRSEWHIVEEE